MFSTWYDRSGVQAAECARFGKRNAGMIRVRERRMGHCATLELRMTSQARGAWVLALALGGCATVPHEPPQPAPAPASPAPEAAAAKPAPKFPAPAALATPPPKAARGARAEPAAGKPKGPTLDLARLRKACKA